PAVNTTTMASRVGKARRRNPTRAGVLYLRRSISPSDQKWVPLSLSPSRSSRLAAFLHLTDMIANRSQSWEGGDRMTSGACCTVRARPLLRLLGRIERRRHHGERQVR